MWDALAQSWRVSASQRAAVCERKLGRTLSAINRELGRHVGALWSGGCSERWGFFPIVQASNRTESTVPVVADFDAALST